MITAHYSDTTFHDLTWVEFIGIEYDHHNLENKWLIMVENPLSNKDLERELLNFKFNRQQILILQKAVIKEMDNCNEMLIPLSEGKIYFDGGWLFDSHPNVYNCHHSDVNYTNKIEYNINYKTAFKIVRKNIHLIV